MRREKAEAKGRRAMGSFGWMLGIVLLLTLAGSATLLFITVRYYWGERGRPPLTGEERRRQRDEEIALRSKQIEKANATPVRERKAGFWDNSKG